MGQGGSHEKMGKMGWGGQLGENHWCSERRPPKVDNSTGQQKETVIGVENNNSTGTRRVLLAQRDQAAAKGAELKQATGTGKCKTDSIKNTENAEPIEDSKKDKQDKEIDMYEHYDLYSEPAYKGKMPANIEIYSNDKFKADTKINEVSNFTLAQFLMEDKVKL
jgi:hypothetical protein